MHDTDRVSPDVTDQPELLTNHCVIVETPDPVFVNETAVEGGTLQQLSLQLETPEMKLETGRIDSTCQVYDLPLGAAEAEVRYEVQNLYLPRTHEPTPQ
jgi:hypothetical protein